MRSVCERYIQHRDDLAMAHDAIMHPLPPPSVMEELLLDPNDPIFDEVDPYFFEKDRQDAIRIKKLRDSYYVDGALQDYYNIYGAGAPFERLFFEARRQLQHAIERLGYERAERAYEEEMDPLFEDCNFIETISLNFWRNSAEPSGAGLISRWQPKRKKETQRKKKTLEGVFNTFH